MKSPFEETFSYTPFTPQLGFDVGKYVDRYWESVERGEEELEEPEVEIVEKESEEVEEIIEGELVEPGLKLEFDPVLEDQTFTGNTFVAPVPLLHLEYNFQLGDTFMVESKNPKNSEVIFLGTKTNFSLFDPSNIDMFNVGDTYKVVNRNVDVKGRPYDYNITFERTKKGEDNV